MENYNILLHVANIYDGEKKYSQALKYLAIHQKHLSPDHLSIAMSYNTIECVHRHLDLYDLVIENHFLLNIPTLPQISETLVLYMR